MQRPAGIAYAGLALLALMGCSAFNISPRCEETSEGLQRLVAIPRITGPVDFGRLNRIVQVSDFVETGNSYNERTCSARVTVGTHRAMVAYRVRQSEGLQNWYGIEFLRPDDSDLHAASAEARAMYESGA